MIVFFEVFAETYYSASSVWIISSFSIPNLNNHDSSLIYNSFTFITKSLICIFRGFNILFSLYSSKKTYTIPVGGINLVHT